MPKPNILFIMPDQLRADYLSCYGAPFISTPHIDSLAQRGVIYQNAYSPSPVCVPARVCLMTGMDAIRNGVLDNGQFLRPDYAACGIRTWPEILSENGYYTAAIGKMHFYPWEIKLGFQQRIIAEDKVWIHIEDDYQLFLKKHGYRKTMHQDRPDYHEWHQAVIHSIPWEYSVDHFVGQETCRFIREYNDDRPFAAMIGFPGPHFPYDPNEEFAKRFDPADMPDSIPEVPEDTAMIRGRPAPQRPAQPSWYAVQNPEFTEVHKKRIRAYYAALIAQIDFEVGAILEALCDKGILENTVIIFSSDHGDYLGDHGLTGKSSYYDQSTRVPMLVRLPAMQGGVRSSELVSLTDVTATILAFAGCPVPEWMDALPMPGLGLADEGHHDHIVGALSGGWMLVNQDWKLAKYARGGAMLFNRHDDPLELHNLARDPRYLDVYQNLDAELTRTIMRSVLLSHGEKRVYTTSLSSDLAFGQQGWPRPYPQRVENFGVKGPM